MYYILYIYSIMLHIYSHLGLGLYSFRYPVHLVGYIYVYNFLLFFSPNNLVICGFPIGEARRMCP